MTDAERRLWSKVRMNQLNGYRFYRQKPLGAFIADFYCPKAKLVIEIDGGQHFEKVKAAHDEVRNGYMEKLGLKVIRFTDTEVLKNIEGVIETILQNLP